MLIQGIILEIRDWRENDRIVSFYTRDLGKIRVLVRSAKKITSKLSGGLAQPFTLLELSVVQGRNFYHLIGSRKIQEFSRIFKDYKKSILCLEVLSKMDYLLKLRHTDLKIFDLLFKFLEKINKSSEKKIDLLKYAFLIKLISLMGYQPVIKKCLICRKSLKQLNQEDYFFHLKKGGIICLNCQNKETEIDFQQEIKISLSVQQILEKLLYLDFNDILRQKFQTITFKQTEQVIEKFLHWYLFNS